MVVLEGINGVESDFRAKESHLPASSQNGSNGFGAKTNLFHSGGRP